MKVGSSVTVVDDSDNQSFFRLECASAPSLPIPTIIRLSSTARIQIFIEQSTYTWNSESILNCLNDLNGSNLLSRFDP